MNVNETASQAKRHYFPCSINRNVRNDVTLSIMVSIVLVTGGSGLVGNAIEYIIATEPIGSRFGKKEGETWIFAGSSEADLR